MSCLNVHIDDAIGSCISANIHRIGGGIDVHIHDAINAYLSASISRIGNGISANIHNLTPTAVGSVTDLGKHISARCSIVCSLLNVIEYINVTPDEIQWITDDLGVFFDVESNTDWIIVTS